MPLHWFDSIAAACRRDYDPTVVSDQSPNLANNSKFAMASWESVISFFHVEHLDVS